MLSLPSPRDYGDIGSGLFLSLVGGGLFAASTMSTGNPVKGIAMIVVGAVIGTIGIDINSGTPRLWRPGAL